MFFGLPCFSGSLSYRNESKALSAKVWAHGGDGPVRKAEMIVFATRSGSSEKRTGGTSEGEGYNGYPASQRTSIPPPGCAGTKVGTVGKFRLPKAKAAQHTRVAGYRLQASPEQQQRWQKRK